MPSEVDIDESAVRAALAGPLERALHRICTQEVESIKEDLSVPVEYDDSGRPIRSQPGERPRMETETLRDHVGYSIDTVDGLPEATIFAYRPPEDDKSDEDAAQILEFGGITKLGVPVAARPFMQPAAERLGTYAAEATADELRSHE